MRNAVVFACVCAMTAADGIAQVVPTGGYRITQPALVGPEYADTQGHQWSLSLKLTGPGSLLGRSGVFQGDTIVGEQDWWMSDQGCIPLGLIDADHTRGDGRRKNYSAFSTSTGIVVGTSHREYPPPSESDFNNDVWYFDTISSVRIGPDGPDYTSPMGQCRHRPLGMNSRGLVLGASLRYPWWPTLNEDCWLFDGRQLTMLGLAREAFPPMEGWLTTESARMNESGIVMGDSVIQTAEGQRWPRAWVFSSGTTTLMGLDGPTYRNTAGFGSSTSWSLLESGVAFGHSMVFAGDAAVGRHPWISDASGTRRIGIDGPAYVGTDGGSTVMLTKSNASGKAAGYGVRRNGLTSTGQDAWVFNGVQSVRVGLTGNGYESAAGYAYSEVSLLHVSGAAAGTTQRMTGSGSSLGEDAWVWNGASTSRVGLIGSEYQLSSGRRLSRVSKVNGAGHAAGISTRYVGFRSVGADTWYFDGTSSVQIGLTGAEYEFLSYPRDPTIVALEEDGTVVGLTLRSVNGQAAGVDAWVFDAAGTRRIGLSGPAHETTTGTRTSAVVSVGPSGLILGTTNRVVNDGPGGQSAWLYDHATDATYPLIFSVSSSGLASTYPLGILSNGLVYGSYVRYEGETDLGFRAFTWSIQGGFVDLGDDAIEGGLTGTGWSRLEWLSGTSESRVPLTPGGYPTHLAGYGVRDGQRCAFMLSAVRPCLSDFNGDGGTDGADRDSFFARWEALATDADLNRDGAVDGMDVVYFFHVWEGGNC